MHRHRARHRRLSSAELSSLLPASSSCPHLTTRPIFPDVAIFPVILVSLSTVVPNRLQDVALTPDGPVLLEINISCNFFNGDYDRAAYIAFVYDMLIALERYEAGEGPLPESAGEVVSALARDAEQEHARPIPIAEGSSRRSASCDAVSAASPARAAGVAPATAPLCNAGDSTSFAAKQHSDHRAPILAMPPPAGSVGALSDTDTLTFGDGEWSGLPEGVASERCHGSPRAALALAAAARPLRLVGLQAHAQAESSSGDSSSGSSGADTGGLSTREDSGVFAAAAE